MATGGGGAMISWSGVITWLNDPLNWRGTIGQAGIIDQIGKHLYYSGIAVLVSLVIGVPLGLLVGHTGRGTWLVSAVNSLRALPSTGLLILAYVIVVAHVRGEAAFLLPTEIVLVLLAIPPILANTYAGVQNVGPAVRDAARGMGMTSSQVLFRVEVPNALPLMFSGLRSAALQVIATATLAAYVGLDGLGRFVYDGLSQRDFPQMVGGAIVVALLALVVDLVLALIQRYAVSRGVTNRFRKRGSRRPTVATEPDSRTASVEKLEAATTTS
ncbi:ABC transporter permease [Jatrophihabitans sp. YIM 134969]